MVVGQISQEKEIIIIGGGPAGYTAAIRLAQLGKEVTLIEENKLGGICLNEGCIPSKLFAHVAKTKEEITTTSKLGLKAESYQFSFHDLDKYKNKVVTQLRKGVDSLCKANKIDIIQGKAIFLDKNRIGVEQEDSFPTFTFQSAIIATGASYQPYEGIPLDGQMIVNQRTIYNLQSFPEHLIVYGTDYIALEAAFSYRSLGSKVTLIEKNEESFSYLDSSIKEELRKQLKKAKINVVKVNAINSYDITASSVALIVETQQGESQLIEGTHLYVQSIPIGNVEDLGLERIGVRINEMGWIDVTNNCNTSVENIYAIGDVTGGDQLAVKAIKQGKVVAEKICGIPTEWDETNIPKVIHTNPPIAYVGLNEEESTNYGYAVNIGKFSLAANGFATIIGKREGFIKIIEDRKTERILGVHIIGANAVELITTGVLGLEMVARKEDFLFPLYPHPSLNEGILEAAEDLSNWAIHQAPVNVKS
ncbi:dihydrolipoyl dehydrogenase [Bacillus kwashiorkori]|uniref:dihydrolipoyl dehydrogenase n=1 Tax=Bacillus kwashiorkori TaxID=1522318 RepID=UPI000781E6DA|nr:dihydrolipoyl dehydrogenase [Bacillus kwashiorkori]